MSYGDFGSLLPSEATYRGPGEGFQVDRSQAIQRGTYLSQMDQFYAQLDEATRQFDLNYGLAERRVELEESRDEWQKDFSYAELEQRGELGHRELDVRESLGWGGIDATNREISSRERMAKDQNELGWARYDLDRTDAMREDSFEDQWANAYAQAGLDKIYADLGMGDDILSFSPPAGLPAAITNYGSSLGMDFSSNPIDFSFDDDYDLDYGLDTNLDAGGTWF